MSSLYQIGLPVEKLSTVFMLWNSYEKPCKILLSPATKNEDWAVIELRHQELAASIVEFIKESRVVENNIPRKTVII